MHARPDDGRVSLTPKQALFVREYLVCLNATKAAERAGYSAKTAHAQGSRLLKNAEVAAAVAKANEERLQRVEVSADEILRELKRLAFFDIADAFDNNNKLKDLKDIPEDARHALAGMEVEELFAGQGEDRELDEDDLRGRTALHLDFFPRATRRAIRNRTRTMNSSTVAAAKARSSNLGSPDFTP